MSYTQCLCNVLAQMIGSVFGAALLKFMFPIDKDLTGDLGTNIVASGWTFLGALVGEFIGTFFLMIAVLANATATPRLSDVSSMPSSMPIGNLSVGLAVFL